MIVCARSRGAIRSGILRSIPTSATSTMTSRALSGDTGTAGSDLSATPGPRNGDDRGLSRDDNAKAKIVSAWNSSAQAYIGAYQGGSTGQIPPGMDAGFKLAAKLVRAHSEKVSRDELQVLDVASAGGEPALTIAEVLPKARVYATDIAPAMVEQIRKRVAEAGVSNVEPGVADGESLSAFADQSLDAVTCTWGLMFMPRWQKAVQEFARVLREGGMVMLTVWEKHPDSLFQRMDRVLNTLSPGFKGLVDPEVLGGDGGRSVAEQLRASAFGDVRVIKFSVPVLVLSALGGGDGADHGSDLARRVWEGCALGTPLEQTLKSWEARGREGVRQEALEVFRAQLEEDWAQGREPLGFPPPHRAAIGHGSSSLEEPSSCVLYVRAIAFVGYKERADS